jgi:SAM-dependent methyltransferase
MGREDVAYRSGVRAKYNDLVSIWGEADRWHAWSHRQIIKALATVRDEFEPVARSSALVVDVGSGGETYGLGIGQRIDVDIAEHRLVGTGRRICANAELLPLRDAIADLTICVGPVINYCSLEEALGELARVTRAGGTVVLHVELSNSWEFAGTDAYRADAAFVETFYEGVETMWVYSDSYVRRSARSYGLQLRRARYFHLVSSLVYRATRRPNLAARAAIADALFRWLPGIRQIADSAIYVFRREG